MDDPTLEESGEELEDFLTELAKYKEELGAMTREQRLAHHAEWEARHRVEPREHVLSRG